MSERTKVLAFEGIGGCGKGTQIKMLKELVEKRGQSVLVTIEHTRGESDIGDLIEGIIKREKRRVDPNALQLMFTADRVNHTEQVIKPAVGEYNYLFLDRYEASTVAYASPEMRRFFLEANQKFTVVPDLTIVIDLDPIEAARRVNGRGDADIFDKAETLRKCRDGYEWYTKNSRRAVVWVDGNGTREEVHNLIVDEVNRRGLI